MVVVLLLLVEVVVVLLLLVVLLVVVLLLLLLSSSLLLVVLVLLLLLLFVGEAELFSICVRAPLTWRIFGRASPRPPAQHASSFPPRVVPPQLQIIDLPHPNSVQGELSHHVV